MLRLVPQASPSAAERARQRVKRVARPDGMLQCARCGCRTAITAVSGSIVRNGRVQGGTVVARYECANCWKAGIFSPMLRNLEPVTVANS